MKRSPAASARVTYSDSRPRKSEPLYGVCDAAGCDRRARATCPECAGEYCLTHVEHSEHGG